MLKCTLNFLTRFYRRSRDEAQAVVLLIEIKSEAGNARKAAVLPVFDEISNRNLWRT